MTPCNWDKYKALPCASWWDKSSPMYFHSHKTNNLYSLQLATTATWCHYYTVTTACTVTVWMMQWWHREPTPRSVYCPYGNTDWGWKMRLGNRLGSCVHTHPVFLGQLVNWPFMEGYGTTFRLFFFSSFLFSFFLREHSVKTVALNLYHHRNLLCLRLYVLKHTLRSGWYTFWNGITLQSCIQILG